jgi:hypothetical protein
MLACGEEFLEGCFYYADGDNLHAGKSRGGEIMGPVPFYKTKVKRTERSRRK